MDRLTTAPKEDMMTNYDNWVTVATSDDRTPIWSGPAENAQPWIDSPQGQACARALAHQGVTLVIVDCHFDL